MRRLTLITSLGMAFALSLIVGRRGLGGWRGRVVPELSQ